jgi:hypothetical protein
LLVTVVGEIDAKAASSRLGVAARVGARARFEE